MNTKKQSALGTSLGLGAALLCAAVIGLSFAPSARADNFNITNDIATGVSVTAWPTNAIGTNGNPFLTGKPVEVQNYEHVGLDLSGFVVVTNTAGANVGFQLLTSQAANPPQLVIGTNALTGAGNSQVLSSDWSTPGSPGSFWVVLKVPMGTNFVHVETNLTVSASSIVSDSSWIGVYSETNALATGEYLTNSALQVHKKILPRSLSGGDF